MELDEAAEMARGLMTEHGLPGWRLVLDGARTRAGVCRPGRREIGLSRHLTVLHSPAEVRDTVLHEIAHALVGSRHGHDAVWRATAVRIGGSGSRLVPREAPRLEGEWVGVCAAGHRVTAHRRPLRVKTCSRCSPTFDLVGLISWTRRGRPAEMHPTYRSELARLTARASSVPGTGAGPMTDESRTAGQRVGATGHGVRVGDLVRLRVGGRFAGAVGRVELRGRTRYRVALDDAVVTVPFAAVELLGSVAVARELPGRPTHYLGDGPDDGPAHADPRRGRGGAR